jgi:hypothetical protein
LPAEVDHKIFLSVHHKKEIIKGITALVVTAHTNYIKVQPLVGRVKKLIIFGSEV